MKDERIDIGHIELAQLSVEMDTDRIATDMLVSGLSVFKPWKDF